MNSAELFCPNLACPARGAVGKGNIGVHSQAFHERLVEDNQLALGQVQADEIKAKTQRGLIWVAMAMMVSTGLWLGGAVGAYRDTALLQKMAQQVRAIALCRLLLIAVDGLNLYPNVFRDAFRTGIPRLAGQIGRMVLVECPNIAIVQVVKSKQSGTWSIQRLIVQGTKTMIEQLLQTTQGGGMTPALTAGAVSILPTLNGSMPPSASAWLACSAVPVIWLAKVLSCKTACLSSAASTIFAISTKACAFAFLWDGMVSIGCSVHLPWRQDWRIIAGRCKNASSKKHRRDPGSKRRVAAVYLIA
jgi:hypothetical protein